MARKRAKKAEEAAPSPPPELAEAPVTPPPPPSAVPTTYRAVVGDGGRVRRVGSPLTEAEAVAERQAGRDVVVCGDDLGANRRAAQNIELLANGEYVRHPPHASAGPYALPHCQPRTRPPQGHTFYETNRLKSASH
jgi:hypothetical protein